MEESGQSRHHDSGEHREQSDHFEHAPLLCHRCGAMLTPGKGDFYVVRIEAFADPTPPNLLADEYADIDPSAEIDRLIELMRHMSEQELMDQVYRRMTIHLCRKCYIAWIENPSG
jgi:hypothetical protein